MLGAAMSTPRFDKAALLAPVVDLRSHASLYTVVEPPHAIVHPGCRCERLIGDVYLEQLALVTFIPAVPPKCCALKRGDFNKDAQTRCFLSGSFNENEAL